MTRRRFREGLIRKGGGGEVLEEEEGCRLCVDGKGDGARKDEEVRREGEGRREEWRRDEERVATTAHAHSQTDLVVVTAALGRR